MFTILYTDNEVKYGEIFEECGQQKWAPIMVYRKRESDPPSVITFKYEDQASQFIKRNIPDGWATGLVILGDDEVQWIKNKGWEIEMFSYPRKIYGNKNLIVGFEILEFQQKPDVFSVKQFESQFQ